MGHANEVARVILVVGCGLALVTTGIALYARGTLGFGLPKAFLGLGNPTLPMTHFLSSSTGLWPNYSGKPKDMHSEEPLPVVFSSPSDSLARVIGHALSGSKTTRKKGLLPWGAACAQTIPLEKRSVPPDVAPPLASTAPRVASELPGDVRAWGATIAPSVTSERSGVLGAQVATIVPNAASEPSRDVKAMCLLKPTLIVLLVLAFFGIPWGMNAAARHAESAEVVADAVPSNGVVPPRSPAVLSEDDIMGAFNALDKRMGFIDRATVNHMLGPMRLPGDLDAADPFLGSAKKLFYDDFRRLARQPGPFADAVKERLTKPQRRKVPTFERAGAFDERRKFGCGTGAAEVAISAKLISLSPHQHCAGTMSNAINDLGERRSWDKLRAELAPKDLLQNSAVKTLSNEDQQEQPHQTRMTQVFNEAACPQVQVDHFSLLDDEPSPRSATGFTVDDLDQYEHTYFPVGGPELCEGRNQREDLPSEFASEMSFVQELKLELERRNSR